MACESSLNTSDWQLAILPMQRIVISLQEGVGWEILKAIWGITGLAPVRMISRKR